MLARMEPTLCEKNVWMYPRLFWETELLGQVLYLEAHAIGISETGIGCFFEDPGFCPSVITEGFCPSGITEGFCPSVITEGHRASVMVSDNMFTDGLIAVANPSVNCHYRRLLDVTEGFWPSVMSSFFVVGLGEDEKRRPSDGKPEASKLPRVEGDRLHSRDMEIARARVRDNFYIL
ncbi:hypothetical protein LR48_Vigan08g096200 [Vigna angularis]|uniref:Uncharacterized protein n=1 Tax=Phaseolus angularis TaxID=3914 RepID=A0A0L9V4X3_PHAAN|nr:hypothetical protein LR48_Vigan08g096200 [Vigna angularis]